MSSRRACRIAQGRRDGQPGSPPQGSVPAWTAGPRSSHRLVHWPNRCSRLDQSAVRHSWRRFRDRWLTAIGVRSTSRSGTFDRGWRIDASATVSPWPAVPALPRCADPWFGVMHRVGRTSGPTTSSSPAVACREILSMRLPASPSGRYRRRDGWHEGATSGRSARLDCAHPPSSAIVGTCRTPSTGSSPSGRRRVRSRDLIRRR